MSEAQRTVSFGSAVGLHARPAATIAKAAAESGHAVTIEAGGKKANAASVLFLLAMGVNHGDEVTLTVVGDNADAVADDMAALIASELDVD
ncbi:HPr family phosphocarrier protein [Salinibacterium hongtaonis]|uniref:Phosphocarrier protein HPr n=1 Tax=Homoserinimonas hongtaonis TaxID=2079791 RepID=A0A2U1SWI5_9MICO|nr:HPr family phosphocarrier protein [Salinibacterium hongtaonis]AWB88569.1 HPr family phosphocarrier protein [Salinibacterium hongtaonis]PWB95980.1 HPr family phosphocarrier protein [Salinibacterium hongtaonis]